MPGLSALSLSAVRLRWQLMQRWPDGIPATADLRALAWQYRQGIWFWPAWILWLKAIGCSTAFPRPEAVRKMTPTPAAPSSPTITTMRTPFLTVLILQPRLKRGHRLLPFDHYLFQILIRSLGEKPRIRVIGRLLRQLLRLGALSFPSLTVALQAHHLVDLLPLGEIGGLPGPGEDAPQQAEGKKPSHNGPAPQTSP